MASRVVYTFTFESMIRGYHEYQLIWGVPGVGEGLNCYRELGNSHDPYAVAVKKWIGGEIRVVGHLPQIISAICSLFIRRGGSILCTVYGSRRYSSDLPQGGLEIPAKVTLTATTKEEATKAKKLIESTLCIDVTRDVTASEERVEAAQGASNSALPAIVICKSGQSSEEVVNLVDQDEPHVDEPPKKKAKIINFEGVVVMGEQLTDAEINFAQSLLKKQFPKLNGLASTLYQEKKTILSEASVQNKLQIIHCNSRQHWIVASTLNCPLGEVKVYDSIFYNCDQETEVIIANLFQCSPKKVRVKVARSQKQKGGSDCGVYAIAFAVAAALGINPSKLKLRQESMRAHLVSCLNEECFTQFPSV